MKIFAIFSICLLLFVNDASAVAVSELYSAQVPVVDYSAQAKQVGIAKALARVLVKVSGNAQIVTIPAVKKQLSKASTLVDSYSYTRVSGVLTGGDETQAQVLAQTKAQPSQGDTQTMLLQVKFSKLGVQALLQQAGLSVWGRERPLVLVWLTIPSVSGQQLVAEGDDSTAIAVLQHVAKQSGLPILFPLLDVYDIGKVSVADIAKFNLPQLKLASSRYKVSTLLVGNVQQQEDDKWQASWHLVSQGEESDWHDTGTSLQQLLTAVVAKTTSVLVKQYAQPNIQDAKQGLVIHVIGIQGLSDYMQVVQYLRDFDCISQVDLQSLRSHDVTLVLKSDSAVSVVIAALKESGKLVPVDAETYRWQVSS